MQFSTLLSATLLVTSSIYAGSNPSAMTAAKLKTFLGGSATQAGERSALSASGASDVARLEASSANQADGLLTHTASNPNMLALERSASVAATQAGDHSGPLINAGASGASDAARLAASHANQAEGLLTHAAPNPLNLERAASMPAALERSASMPATLSKTGETVAAAPLQRSASSPLLVESVPVGVPVAPPAAINAAAEAGSTAEKGGAGSWIRNMNPFGKKAPAEPKEFGPITQAEAEKIAADKAVRNGNIKAGLIGGGVGLATGGIIGASMGEGSEGSVNVIQPAGAVQGNAVPGTF